MNDDVSLISLWCGIMKPHVENVTRQETNPKIIRNGIDSLLSYLRQVPYIIFIKISI